MPHAREWRRRVSELPPRTGRFRRARAHQPGYYHRPVTCCTPPPPPRRGTRRETPRAFIHKSCRCSTSGYYGTPPRRLQTDDDTEACVLGPDARHRPCMTRTNQTELRPAGRPTARRATAYALRPRGPRAAGPTYPIAFASVGCCGPVDRSIWPVNAAI
jgi:hypothetical protein